MKKVLLAIVVFVMGVSGCQMQSNQPEITDINTEEIILKSTIEEEEKEDVAAVEDINTFSLSDLLIVGHDLLGKCPYWNTNWDILKEESSEIIDTYSDSFPGTPDKQLIYWESEGITYVTDDNFIAAIILTNDTYSLNAGIRVGDELTQILIDKYNLIYRGKSSPDGNATIMTGTERKSSQKLDYDCIFTGTTFISKEENDFFMESFLEDNNFEETPFGSKETGIAVSFFVKEGIIVGICMEYIV